jgi:hypothetical protein
MAHVIDDNFLADYFKHSSVSAYSSIDKNLLTKPSAETLDNVSTSILAKGNFNYVCKEVVAHLIQHMSPLDWLLFLTEQGYREHRCHQIRVAAVAVWLLEELYPNQEKFGEHRRGAVLGALWASAMLHDHGYALSRLARLRSVLAAEEREGPILKRDVRNTRFANLKACYTDLFAVSLADHFCVPCNSEASAEVINIQLDEQVREALTHYLGMEAIGLDRELLNKLRACYLYDHGLWSAANLSATLNQFGMPWNYLSEPERKTIQMVIHAIAIHNRPDFQGTDFDMSRNPIAGILLLADELQEWERRIVPITEPQDLHCRVEIELANEKQMLIRFIYLAEELLRAKWNRNETERWKKDAIETRVNGADGLPRIEVSVQEEQEKWWQD